MFADAGIAKLRTGNFRRDLASYQLFPAALLAPVAAGLPWLEVCLGILLLAGLAAEVALAAVSLLLVAFGAGMTINLWRKRSISCGCTGNSTSLISWWLVGRNLIVAGAAAVVAVHGRPLSLQSLAGSSALSGAGARELLLAIALAALSLRLLGRVRDMDHDRLSRVPTILGWLE
jgi:hypothetical protein